MSDWIVISILTLSAGLAMVLGAAIAAIEHIGNRWLETEIRHAVIAFGGGVLLSAVSLVLVHEGMKNLSFIPVILCFGFGGFIVMTIDKVLTKKREHVSQLAAMLLDFVPEVIALGAIYLLDKPYALLLGLLIVFQNIPEGFNAFLEIRSSSKHRGWFIICVFLAMSIIGPIAGLTGYFFLSESPEITSGFMLFASGGILYLVFQDIAPQAVLKKHWAPSFGAVVGFLFGMIGKMFIGYIT